MNGEIKVHDKYFVPFITEEQLQQAIDRIAEMLNKDYAGKNPLCIPILNGTFMFTSDLFKRLNIDIEVCFVKLASYKGVQSTGHVITAIGMEKNITDREVLIIDDILDTGKTLHHFISGLYQQKPKSIKSVVLLYKPDSTVYPIKPDYTGLSIPSKFVLGYGLDYDGLGRNLPSLYCLKDENNNLS